VLAEIRHPDAVPALIATLRDPVLAVSAWACYALERIGDREALPALQRYHQRLLSLAARGAVPASAGSPDDLLAQSCRARSKLGDARAEAELVALLTSSDAKAAATATQALRERFGAEIDLDPTASTDERRAWVERWRPQR
jgi:HEAT repeat protein